MSALAVMAPGVSKAQEGPAPPDVARDTAATDRNDDSSSPVRRFVSAQVVETYSSNLYHEQRRHEADFDRNAPGERYWEMEGPGDFITEAGLEGGLKWKLGDERSAKASLAGAYFLHVRNPIANYFGLSASGSYDLARHDRLALDVDAIPRRFKKNYSIREVGGNKLYEHAFYWEIEPALSYRHEWSSRWDTELTYELGVRRYLSPFENRDTTRNGVTVVVGHDFGAVEAGLGVGGAIGTTPSGLEFGIPVDRSYRDVEPLALAELDLTNGFSAGVEVGYRFRHYTTDEPANDTYFDRTDRRWYVELEAKKHLGQVFAVLANAGWIRNDTNRQDHPNVDPEDLAYQEGYVGIGVEGTL